MPDEPTTRRTVKRYIGIDPAGEPCGPCVKEEDLCWKALRIGYERTFHKPATDDLVRELGYSVSLCTVEWIPQKEEEK